MKQNHFKLTCHQWLKDQEAFAKVCAGFRGVFTTTTTKGGDVWSR